MALNPEVIYPEAITNIGSLESGAFWYKSYLSSGDQEQRFKLATVKHIDVSDLTTANIDMSTAKVYEILRFANGTKLNAHLWAHQIPGYIYWYVEGELRLDNGNSSIAPNIPGLGTYVISGGAIIISKLELAQQYGIKFAMLTEFGGQATGGTIENLTPAENVHMICFIPIWAESAPDSFQSWAHIQSGLTLKYDVVNGYPQVTSPDDIAYPAIPLFQVNNCFTYTDIDDLRTQLNQQAPISDDDIYKIGNIDTPVQDDDPSKPGGGGGNYDDTSDPIDFPAAPTGGAITSGAIKAFLVSNGNMQSFMSKLWNISIFDIETQFQKLVQEPMECIVTLHCLPVLPTVGAAENIKLGSFDSEVVSPRITSQYVDVDCGALSLSEYWGSALDYAPYTDLEIFLPFIGVRSIKIEDAQNAIVHVKYRVDVFSGSLVAFVKCGQSVLYTFSGSCIQHCPVTARSSDQLKNIINAVGAIGTGIASGGATAGNVLSAAFNVIASKNHVQRSGDLAGASGILGEFVPYVIIHRPIQSLASKFSAFKGYPANITYQLSSLSGYTEVEYIHLTDINGATDTELNEIETLLKNGVII